MCMVSQAPSGRAGGEVLRPEKAGLLERVKEMARAGDKWERRQALGEEVRVPHRLVQTPDQHCMRREGLGLWQKST